MKRAIVILALLVARRASAHPLDLGYLRIDVHGRSADVSLDLEAGLASRMGETIFHAAPFDDGADCTWDGTKTTHLGSTTTLTDRVTCARTITTVAWSLPFITRASSTFQILGKLRGLGDDRVITLDRNHTMIDERADASVRTIDFVRTGIAHIGAAPSEWRDDRGWHLPDGLDHILFVLALLLAGGSLAHLARVVTGFTIGHTIALALATFGVVRPPASIIEPAIALSIMLVAADAFARRPARVSISTAFGLVHGFGFAGALAALDLAPADTAKALFGFNLGVELGQLTILAIAAPIVLAGRQSLHGRTLVDRILPALIFVAGTYWFVGRILG